MGLRQYVNDLEIFKKVNCGERGKRFENGDFARSVEGYMNSIVPDIRDIRDPNPVVKAGAIFSTLTHPLGFFLYYSIVKQEKEKNSAAYKNFLSNPDLVLNH